MEASPDKFERLLSAHLEVNPKSWAALTARGVDEETLLQLDFEYTAPGENEVRSLLRHLRSATDYEFQGGARDKKDGERQWMVIGTTTPMTLSPAVLDEWVTRMTEYGRDHGPAEFDGWGAKTPESAPDDTPGGIKGLLEQVKRARLRR
ncbi:MAG: ribonuclease E inhibitor RraB [Solirubrobacteraceae bacterium]